MPNEKGLACLLRVGVTAASPASYVTLEGQTDTSFDGSVNISSTSDKDTGAWETGIATTRSGTVTASGNLKTPRPQLDALQTAWQTGTTHACSIVFDSTGAGYRGDFYISSYNVSGSHTDVGKYSITLTPAAALTPNTIP